MIDAVVYREITLFIEVVNLKRRLVRMVGIIITSHGAFAEGILQSGNMIFGEQENVRAVTLQPSEGPDDFKKKLEDAIQSLDNADQILFLVDLWGGTPFNQVNNLFEAHKDTWAVVTGLNLPLLVEAYGARMSSESSHEIAAKIAPVGQDGVKVKPEELQTTGDATQTAKVSNAGAPGKMNYVLARIDTRLLHGQIATAWTKATNPTRIIVVSDAVAKDELRRNLIQQAAPVGVHAHVVPIDHMIELAKDDQHFGNERVMLLFETPQDALRLVRGGVDLKTINVGSMAHAVGKVQPNKVLAFDQDDIDTFAELAKDGVEFDVRKVPSNSKDNMDEILKKAQNELNREKK